MFSEREQNVATFFPSKSNGSSVTHNGGQLYITSSPLTSTLFHAIRAQLDSSWL